MAPPSCLCRGGSSTPFAWSPFGGGAERTGNTASLQGFNGENQDPRSGVSHLGNGYRAYSPALRRFTCPDSESPFGGGGINPYVYCEHDPVNRTDPSGHMPRKTVAEMEKATRTKMAALNMKSEQAKSLPVSLSQPTPETSGTASSIAGATGHAPGTSRREMAAGSAGAEIVTGAVAEGGDELSHRNILLDIPEPDIYSQIVSYLGIDELDSLSVVTRTTAADTSVIDFSLEKELRSERIFNKRVEKLTRPLDDIMNDDTSGIGFKQARIYDMIQRYWHDTVTHPESELGYETLAEIFNFFNTHLLNRVLVDPFSPAIGGIEFTPTHGLRYNSELLERQFQIKRQFHLNRPVVLIPGSYFI